jgi:hypothetical protein
VLCAVCCVLCDVYCVLCTVYCVLIDVYCVLLVAYCVLCILKQLLLPPTPLYHSNGRSSVVRMMTREHPHMIKRAYSIHFMIGAKTYRMSKTQKDQVSLPW